MGIKMTDMDQVEPLSGGALLTPGRHTVRIIRAEEGESSGGHPQVELEFESEAGIGSIRDWIVFAPSTRPGEVPFAVRKARSLLDSVMIEPQGGDWEFPTQMLVDRKLCIVVGDEPDNRDPSKTRRRVQAYEHFNANDLPADDKPLPF